MRILVCIKQVPDMEQPLRIDESTGTADSFDPDAYRISRFDLLAVEEAIRIRETCPSTRVDILTAGPDRSAKALRRALGMGGNCGIHLRTAHEASISPFVIAQWIAAYIGEKDYDLVLTGIMSEDLMQGLVGPLIAEFLHWPCATAVVYQNIMPGEQKMYVECDTGAGLMHMMEIALPAVITVQSGFHQPRYPSLSNLLRANRSELEIIDAEIFGSPSVRQDTIRLLFSKKSRAGLIIDGTPEEKATRLITILRERGCLP